MSPEALAALLKVLPADWRRFEASGIVIERQPGWYPPALEPEKAAAVPERVGEDELRDLGLGRLVKALRKEGAE